MLRSHVQFTLAIALVGAGLMVSTAAADDCPACRAARGANNGTYAPRANTMGSVAYGTDAANCRDRSYPRPDLFYNFYANGPCGGYPAQMYVSPRPVPAHVGHTYITYQPMMPHEFMYNHHRTYHQYYDGGRGLTRTKAVWW